MSVLKVGDKVSWRGSWGRDLPREVTIASIEVNCINKSGTQVQEVDWSFVNNRSVIVDFSDVDNWAYGTQISKIN